MMKALQVVVLALLLLAIGFVAGTLHGAEARSYALSLFFQGSPPASRESCANLARDAAAPLIRYWIVFKGGSWRVKIATAEEPLGVFDTEAEAEHFARQLAQVTCPARIDIQQESDRQVRDVIIFRS